MGKTKEEEDDHDKGFSASWGFMSMFLVVKQSGELAGIAVAATVIINILFAGYEL
jgi:hypothetical protein